MASEEPQYICCQDRILIQSLWVLGSEKLVACQGNDKVGRLENGM